MFYKYASATLVQVRRESASLDTSPGAENITEKYSHILELYKNAQLVADKITPDQFKLNFRRSLTTLGANVRFAGNSKRIAPVKGDFLYGRAMAVHGDQPNNNGDMFEWGSREDKTKPELLRFDDKLAKQVYQTFIGKGFYKDHKNDSVTYSKGILLDAIPNFERKGIEVLFAVDSKKDPELVRGIEQGYITDVSMGCFQAGTKITMKDSTVKPIEDIKVGDEVLTTSGRIKRVTKLFSALYNKGIYKIKFLGRSHGSTGTLFVTEEHPFYVIKKENINQIYRVKQLVANGAKGEVGALIFAPDYERELVPEFIKVSDLRVGDYVAIPYNEEVKKTAYSTREMARLLGYYLSEGYVGFESRADTNGEKVPVSVSFSFHNDEKEFISEVMELCKLLTRKEPKVETSLVAHCSEVIIHDRNLASTLYYLGGKYSKSKKLAEEVLYWPPELQLEIIGTFINGDGFSKDGISTLETASENLAYQFEKLLLRNKIIYTIEDVIYPPCEGFNSKPSQTWKISIGKTYSPIISKYSYKVEDTELVKEKNQKFFYNNCLFVPITSIEFEEYDGKIYNFEVQDEETYIANGIGVHNCRVGYSICSICGHSATNEQEYCSHVKMYKGGSYAGPETGWKGLPVYEINRNVEFIELSAVTTGADGQAKILEKIAKLVQNADGNKLKEIVASLNFVVDAMETNKKRAIELLDNALKILKNN
jgi:hypothetical protein